MLHKLIHENDIPITFLKTFLQTHVCRDKEPQRCNLNVLTGAPGYPGGPSAPGEPRSPCEQKRNHIL